MTTIAPFDLDKLSKSAPKLTSNTRPPRTGRHSRLTQSSAATTLPPSSGISSPTSRPTVTSD